MSEIQQELELDGNTDSRDPEWQLWQGARAYVIDILEIGLAHPRSHTIDGWEKDLLKWCPDDVTVDGKLYMRLDQIRWVRDYMRSKYEVRPAPADVKAALDRKFRPPKPPANSAELTWKCSHCHDQGWFRTYCTRTARRCDRCSLGETVSDGFLAEQNDPEFVARENAQQNAIAQIQERRPSLRFSRDGRILPPGKRR